MDITNKQFNLDATSVKVYEENEVLYIEGMANTTQKDRVGDVVLESAWLGAMESFLLNPILLGFHDHTHPIGSIVDYNISANGLYIKAKISKTAVKIKQLIKEGVLKAFSIGFSVTDAKYDESSDTFYIKALELLEVSIVSVPANQFSLFSIAKSLNNDDELTQFKQQFTINKEVIMTEEKLALEAKKAIALEKAPEAFDMEAAFKDLANTLAKAVAPVAVPVAVPVPAAAPAVVVETGTDKLLKEVEARFAKSLEDSTKASADSLAGLRTELSEKAAELEAMTKSKMTFESNSTAGVTREEKEVAIMTAKLLSCKLEDTKCGKAILTKAGSTGNVHIPSTEWENEFSTNVVDDIRKKLVIEPLFRRIMMNAYNLYIPINPDPAASEVTWVQRSAFGSATSSGAAQITALTEQTLTAYKVATKEYLNDEEDEDAILAVAPIIRDSIIRRMAKGADKAMLVGAGNGTTDPLTGVATIATTAGGIQVTTQGGTLAATDKVTVSDLSTVRRGLGEWGLNPSDVVYIVSNEAYYDLLDDTDFRTVDLVGLGSATILNGQIGAINGSPVVVSGEFNAKGADVPYAACVNKSNFLVGELRGLRMERDRNIEDQRDVLVATRRLGFVDVISGAGTSVLTYPST